MKCMNLKTVVPGIMAAIALLAIYPVVGAISAEPQSGIVSCAGHVYTVDPDPKGTNVRSAPHKNSPVVIVIPNDSESTVVDLSASFEDWVEIHAAQGVTSGFRFEGEGWIYAPLLAVTAVHPSGRKVPLYSKPDAASPVIEFVTGETEARLAGCSADWMRVKIGKRKGWLAPGDYCGNPVTTCVGIHHEQRENEDGKAASLISTLHDAGGRTSPELCLTNR